MEKSSSLEDIRTFSQTHKIPNMKSKRENMTCFIGNCEFCVMLSYGQVEADIKKYKAASRILKIIPQRIRLDPLYTKQA